MGPNAWLWFLPLKTALGDGINFPTRIPLAECSTFHSIGELCFDTFPVKTYNCEQASLCQVGQRLQVGPWSTRCLGRKGSLSSPPCRAPQAAPLTASWTSPRTRRWSRTRSPRTVVLQKPRSSSTEKPQSKSNHEVWHCQVLRWCGFWSKQWIDVIFTFLAPPSPSCACQPRLPSPLCQQPVLFHVVKWLFKTSHPRQSLPCFCLKSSLKRFTQSLLRYALITTDALKPSLLVWVRDSFVSQFAMMWY